MHERAARQAQHQDEEFRSYVQQPHRTRRRVLRTSRRSWPACVTGGVITAAEFDREKAKVLA